MGPQKQSPRLDPKRLVFVAETSVSATIARPCGRAPQGERLAQNAARQLENHHFHWCTTP
jgi:hypothetical protein